MLKAPINWNVHRIIDWTLVTIKFNLRMYKRECCMIWPIFFYGCYAICNFILAAPSLFSIYENIICQEWVFSKCKIIIFIIIGKSAWVVGCTHFLLCDVYVFIRNIFNGIKSYTYWKIYYCTSQPCFTECDISIKSIILVCVYNTFFSYIHVHVRCTL